MSTINTELKEYHFYGKDMVEGIYYRKADVDKLIESLTACHNIEPPNPPKPRRATNRELARWLIEGNAQIQHSDSDMVYVGWNYNEYEDDFPCSNDVLVRKWSDTEWHEPTVDYLGIDDKDYNFNKKYKGE